MRNRIHNSTNPYQGTAKRILTVCSAGLLRSPTLAVVLAQKGFNTRSAGCVEDYALIAVDDVLIHWAEEIVFVNKESFDYTKFHHKLDGKTIKVLDIPDKYPYMDVELQDLCIEQYDNTEAYVFNSK